jgi:hypothetical protein
MSSPRPGRMRGPYEVLSPIGAGDTVSNAQTPWGLTYSMG